MKEAHRSVFMSFLHILSAFLLFLLLQECKPDVKKYVWFQLNNVKNNVKLTFLFVARRGHIFYSLTASVVSLDITITEAGIILNSFQVIRIEFDNIMKFTNEIPIDKRVAQRHQFKMQSEQPCHFKTSSGFCSNPESICSPTKMCFAIVNVRMHQNFILF